MKLLTSLFVGLLIAVIPISVNSQTKLDEVKLLIQNQEHNAALTLLNAMDTKDPEIIYYQGFCNYSLGDLEAAIQAFHQVLSFEDDRINALGYNGKAKVKHEIKEYDSAIYYYKKALELTPENEEFHIELLINIGYLEYVKNHYQLAKEYYFKAKKLYDTHEHNAPILNQLVYGSIGEYYLLKYDYGNAERNYQLALSIAQNIFPPEHFRISELHKALAHVYMGLENDEKIVAHMQAHYEIIVQNASKGSYNFIVANNDLGMSYMNIGRFDLAEPYLDLAFEDMKTYFPTFDIGLHIVGMNLGITHYKLGHLQKAKELLVHSIGLGLKSFGQKAQTVAEASDYLAFVYEETGEFEKALESFQNSIDANALFKPGEQLNPRIETIDVRTLSHALQERARFYVTRYLETNELENLQNAKKDADLNLEFLLIHQETFSEESRASLSYELTYANYISSEINWHLFQETGNPEHLEQIFNNAERNKSDLLRANLNLTEAREFANIPKDLVVLEKDLKIEKEEFRAKIIAAENSNEAYIPWDSLIMIQNQLDSVTDLLREHVDPSFAYQWKSMEEIQNAMGNKEGLIEYLYNEDVLFKIFISKNEVHIGRDSIKNLDQKIITFREEIRTLSEFFSTRSDLYETLLADLPLFAKEIDKLKIIPDGPLHYLPFELLGTNENYLLEKFDITYLNYLDESLRPTKTNDLLLSFAPEFNADKQLASLDLVRDELTSIPGAFEEVQSINKLFNGETLTASLATETSFKKEAKNYGIIHMATHAIIDDANPETSRLVFNLSQDTLNDGYLHAYEIYNLDLNAQLVTLSACNTGYGKIKRGEGVMSLSWAFAYAGAPATVVSLWPASDKSTPALMEHFYQNLKEGQTKDKALNNARKQYLQTATGKARHPFYWGGFVLIGDNAPIEESRNLLVWVFPITIILVLIGTLLRRRRKV